MQTRRALLAALVATAALNVALGRSATAQEARTQTLEVSDGFARATPALAATGIAYLTIRSLGPADRLLGFRSPACDRPELHTHIEQDGVMMMRQVDGIDIPAGGTVALRPGVYHLMLIDLAKQLVGGELREVTLIFEQAGEVTVELPIKGIAAMF